MKRGVERAVSASALQQAPGLSTRSAMSAGCRSCRILSQNCEGKEAVKEVLFNVTINMQFNTKHL